jgi:hypothetical protein
MVFFRLGSVAAHVIRYSACDVLVVPPPRPESDNSSAQIPAKRGRNI